VLTLAATLLAGLGAMTGAAGAAQWSRPTATVALDPDDDRAIAAWRGAGAMLECSLHSRGAGA
jgi:hypothetical protein